jgi:hypothetical protein
LRPGFEHQRAQLGAREHRDIDIAPNAGADLAGREYVRAHLEQHVLVLAIELHDRRVLGLPPKRKHPAVHAQ